MSKAREALIILFVITPLAAVALGIIFWVVGETVEHFAQ